MEEKIQLIALSIPGFLMAISCHEAAHALMAYLFGDSTAKQQDRLSLNPIHHYDLVGTIILPLALILMGSGVMFGYARPVPVDPRNFKNIRKGVFWVSFAGPLANVALAIISVVLVTLVNNFVPQGVTLIPELSKMLYFSVLINTALAVFNLIPWPPLDGSKMVSTFLDYNTARKYEDLQQWSLLFFIILWQTNLLSYLMGPAYWAIHQMMISLNQLFA